MRCGCPAADDDQRLERVAGILAERVEPLAQLDQHLVEGQRRQLERLGLPVERPLAIGEQPPHQRRLRAGVDVGRGVAVVLHVRAQQSVEGRAGAEQVLELVEDHQRRLPVLLVQPERQVEQLGRGRERGVV